MDANTLDLAVSCRGCRKHVYEKHPWYKYFDQKPIVISNTVEEKGNVIISKPSIQFHAVLRKMICVVPFRFRVLGKWEIPAN
jgi:predicted Fe-S protein YdhL (DUF1289 family)